MKASPHMPVGSHRSGTGPGPLHERLLEELERQLAGALADCQDDQAPIELAEEAYGEAIIRTYRTVAAGYSGGKLQPVRDLARMYEEVLDYTPAVTGGTWHLKRSGISGRKRHGSYYTPDGIIAYIIANTLEQLVQGNKPRQRASAKGVPLASEEILNLKVLDPAMGSGLFLLAALDCLTRAYMEALEREGRQAERPRNAEDLATLRRLIAASCLYGVDINPTAVAVAGIIMGILTKDHGASGAAPAHLKCGNSLLGAAGNDTVAAFERDYEAVLRRLNTHMALSGSRLFHWEQEFPDVFRQQDGTLKENPGFDLVIGNPPYLSYSGRHRGKDAEAVAATYRARGRAAGWITAHGLFMIRAMELVKDGGLVSMIVPDQVGHLKGYGDVRSRVLEQGQLCEVRYWGEHVFEGVTTPSMTFVVRKSGNRPAPKTVMVGRLGRRTQFRPVPGDEWHSSPSREILHDLIARHERLVGFADPGVHSGNVATSLILNRRLKGALPILEGRQVHAFYCEPPERWLNLAYKPETGEYFRISPASIYKTTDIILRQTADRPVAARHIHRCHFRNSVLALRIPPCFSIEYILGVLNSDAAAWLYRTMAFESGQRAFPQVKVGRLKRIPIPDPALPRNRQGVARIEEIVRTLEAGSTSPDWSDPLVVELNTLVLDLFGLEGAPRKEIASLRPQ